jgi:hypothetical protein
LDGLPDPQVYELARQQERIPHSIGFSGSKVQGRIDSLPTSRFAG